MWCITLCQSDTVQVSLSIVPKPLAGANADPAQQVPSVVGDVLKTYVAPWSELILIVPCFRDGARENGGLIRRLQIQMFSTKFKYI